MEDESIQEKEWFVGLAIEFRKILCKQQSTKGWREMNERWLLFTLASYLTRQSIQKEKRKEEKEKWSLTLIFY